MAWTRCVKGTPADQDMSWPIAVPSMKASSPWYAARHMLTDADDIPRFSKARITAEMSPAIFHEPVVEKIPHLLKWAFNPILETGAHMSIGSDWFLPENPSLFDALSAIVDKIEYHPGGRPSAALSEGKSKRERGGEILCQVITRSGAEAVGAQHRTGSLEVGKTANFIAVDRDLSRGEFAGATVLKTWFEGRMVHDTEGLCS